MNEDQEKRVKHLPWPLRMILRCVYAGISAAGIVNTLAPGLFSAMMGYAAGSLRGTDFSSFMAGIGLFSLGAFATPTLSSWGILALGAAVGLLVGLIALPFRLAWRHHRARRKSGDAGKHLPFFKKQNDPFGYGEKSGGRHD